MNIDTATMKVGSTFEADYTDRGGKFHAGRLWTVVRVNKSSYTVQSQIGSRFGESGFSFLCAYLNKKTGALR